MNDNRYLIACDLDGTLLQNDQTLSERTIKEVKKIIDAGHIFCIITGRPYRGAIHIYNQLGLKTLMANYNGSYISNPSDPDFDPINMKFNAQIVSTILNDPFINKNITNAVIESDDHALIFNDTEDEQFLESFKHFFHIPFETQDKVLFSLDNCSRDVNSLLLYVKDKNIFDSIVYHVKKIAPTLAVRSWSLPQWENFEVIEINSAFADKAMAMRYLSSYYGIPLDRCIAFGDGENDLTMLNQAGYGFAMKNGTRAAKLLARHITKHTNTEDGVVWEINYFLSQLKK
ncbi:HAD family hydrolase [Ureaplasma zalophigenitalium]|uniref:HAD family hydrolase n=1 Tax=Ureaplasma zalophigenitalium TaxID=907723 RepID=A0ABT3BNJ3_9BACT|nr:HAD family hydrolase [Ureaplasma zalophigenitalium]MCV3753814.1 HAD family hydrolase [Ureaplasma zalophigenitalium]